MNRSIALLLLSLTSTGWIVAETWTLGSLPTRPTKLGFALTVQVEAVSGNGYQPIHLDFTPSGKSFRRDRHVEVTISPRHQFGSNFQYSFRRSITLPEGSGAFSKTLYVPHYHQWSTVGVELKEDGVRVKEGKATFGVGNISRRQFASQKVTVGIIQPHDAAKQDAAWKKYPDVRTLVTVLGDGPIPESDKTSGNNIPVATRLSHLQSLNLAKTTQPAWVQFRPLDENDLSDHWLGYSQLDVIIAPAPVVDRIATDQPNRMNELKSWLAAGGNLWIYASDASDGPFTSSLRLSTVPLPRIVGPEDVPIVLKLSENNDMSELVFDGQRNPQKKSQHYSYQGNIASMSQRRIVFEELQENEHPFAKVVPTKQVASGIRRGSFGLGEVIAIAHDDPFPGSYQFWKSIARLQTPERLHWPTRNGIDVGNGNDNYWSWLIRSVGQPPVKSFVLLNLLFAILIGPVFYSVLRRRERLYLLYFVAPCLALLVTSSLFAYALLSDGIATKQRTRQLTWIDPQAGYNVSQSRATYYRVFGFGQKIDVSGDATVYPIRHSPIIDRYYSRRTSEGKLHGIYSVADGRQQLASGFLPSRNQVQYLITLPRKTDESIVVDWKSSEITNHLPQKIHQLLVSDQQGNYWEATNFASGSTVGLRPCRGINTRLDNMLGSKVLPKADKIPILNTFSWAQNTTGSQVSFLENRLQRWSGHLPANSFIGVAEIDTERLGISQARVLDSVHVVMGELP